MLHILIITKHDSSTVPFFTGQFSYRPLIWTFCSRQSNNFINKRKKRALRVTHNDYDSCFSEHREMCNESTIHIKNTKVVMTDIYEFLNYLLPPTKNDIFQKQGNYYSLRNLKSLGYKRKFTNTYGIDTIYVKERQIWQDLPQDIKNSDSLNLFKSNIKKYGTLTCHYKLCKSYK